MHAAQAHLALVAAAISAAGLVLAQTPGPAGPLLGHDTAAAPTRPAQDDREFMKEAAQAGRAQVQASQIALSKATDPAVKEFAWQMIQDHTEANTRLQQLARRKGVALPSEPSVMHESKLQLLEAADGPEVDRQFVDTFGIEAHRASMRQFHAELDEGRDADVKGFVEQALPRLEEHLQRARDMQASLEKDAAAQRSAAISPASRMGASRASSGGNEANEARREISRAVQVVHRMKADPNAQQALERAKGVFIVPDHGRAAPGAGAQGGRGMLVTRKGSGFSNPVFYKLGGLGIGAQSGAPGGEFALLLMTDKAVREFRSGKRFSLNADAGLTVAQYTRRARAPGGKPQDVVIWPGAQGAYAGVSTGLDDVVYDRSANQAYYGTAELDPSRIIDEGVRNPGRNILGMALAAV